MAASSSIISNALHRIEKSQKKNAVDAFNLACECINRNNFNPFNQFIFQVYEPEFKHSRGIPAGRGTFLFMCKILAKAFIHLNKIDELIKFFNEFYPKAFREHVDCDGSISADVKIKIYAPLPQHFFV